MVDDVLAANARYSESFRDPHLAGTAAKGLAVLTCIDSRIDPLAMLGLVPGDAKILRNAGARATTDALRGLAMAVNFLDVTRICVVVHTDCAMSGRNDDDVRHALADRGIPADGWEFHTAPDQIAALASDMTRIRECPLISKSVEVVGLVLDVHTGRLSSPL
jgi:carbonic anhydrase